MPERKQEGLVVRSGSRLYKIFARSRHRAHQWLISGRTRVRAYAWLRPTLGTCVVRGGTELVIEGFPRSGNTYASIAFDVANPGAVHRATHLHSPVNLETAVRRGIPAVVLLREPLDAVTSFVQRSPALSARALLQDYSRFYTRTAPLLDNVVVAPFEAVTNDFGSILVAVNRRFGTNFTRYEITAENELRVRNGIEWSNSSGKRRRGSHEMTVSRPSAQRNVVKPVIREGIAADCIDELARARAAYLSVLRAAHPALLRRSDGLLARDGDPSTPPSKPIRVLDKAGSNPAHPPSTRSNLEPAHSRRRRVRSGSHRTGPRAGDGRSIVPLRIPTWTAGIAVLVTLGALLAGYRTGSPRSSAANALLAQPAPAGPGSPTPSPVPRVLPADPSNSLTLATPVPALTPSSAVPTKRPTTQTHGAGTTRPGTIPTGPHPSLGAPPFGSASSPAVLVYATGTGLGQTHDFATAANWSVYWNYNCSNLGRTGNFDYSGFTTDGSGTDISGRRQFGSGETGVDHYNEAGTFQLLVNSDCSWKLEVVS